MPVHSEDDHDDNESLISMDDVSSHHTGDNDDYSLMDSDEYELLSRSSSQAQTEEDDVDYGEDDDAATTDGEMGSIITPSYNSADNTVNDSSSDDTTGNCTMPPTDDESEQMLQHPELPRVLPLSSSDLNDSTATITPTQRRDTPPTPPPPEQSETVADKPFNILYVGSPGLKNSILRKLGQALMAASLKDRSSLADSSTEWSSGYTSVVPISDFHSSDRVPEVEFVEDSLVKMRIMEIDSLQGFTSRRQGHYLCQLSGNTRVISCSHSRRDATCPWLDSLNTYPSLLVYSSPVRSEKSTVHLQKVEAFAELHHIPLLVVSDWEKTKLRVNYSWNGSLAPEFKGHGKALGYSALSSKQLLQVDSVALGRSLWHNANLSQEKVKSSKPVSLFIFKLTKTTTRCFTLEKVHKFRIAATVVALFLFLLHFPVFPFKSISPSHSEPQGNILGHSLITTPTDKLKTVPSTTITITEKVTIPIVQTKTVSTTITPKSQVSKIYLTPIVSSINVPRASLLPFAEDSSNHKYIFRESEQIQVFLHSPHSVLVYLPSPIASLHVSVLQNEVQLPFTVHPLKRSPLVLVTWPKSDSSEQVLVKLKGPGHEHSVVLDFSEPIIDPRVWELLERSNREAWKRMSSRIREITHEMQFSEKVDALKQQAEVIREHAWKLHGQVRDNAERQFQEVTSLVKNNADRQYKVMKNRLQRLSTENENWFMRVPGQVHGRMREYVRVAQGQAVRLGGQVQKYIKEKTRQDGFKMRGKWYNKACASSRLRCRKIRTVRP
jgi:hypothetical protein